ncbi:MAG: flagellar protein FliS [Gemmataceae bacterium]|nr:flagellar protein FliS [Gemmataceae bacterium]
MIPSRAYRQQQDAGWTRIDLLLALYDGTIDRLRRALAALRQGDPAAAAPLLARVQMLLLQMAAGINPDAGDPSSADLLRLAEFCIHAAASGEAEKIEAAASCLETVREGFRAIRDEAVRLERSGAVPPARNGPLLEMCG